tara:strand:- start:3248 stop:3766 length:519 start_codon:yes stop_codon:yes gene_type:complete
MNLGRISYQSTEWAEFLQPFQKIITAPGARFDVYMKRPDGMISLVELVDETGIVRSVTKDECGWIYSFQVEYDGFEGVAEHSTDHVRFMRPNLEHPWWDQYGKRERYLTATMAWRIRQRGLTLKKVNPDKHLMTRVAHIALKQQRLIEEHEALDKELKELVEKERGQRKPAH